MNSLRLSIIVPVYNEAKTIQCILDRLATVSKASGYEIIIVDDGSTDGTTDLIRTHLPNGARFIQNDSNQGKSAAVRNGLALAAGDWVLVQDADLEYDPSEIPKLLTCATNATVAVYGRRPSHWERPARWVFASGVLLVDLAIFIVYGKWLRDHASCYKLVRRQTLCNFNLQSNGFEGCIEITAKLMRSGIKIVQVPISYAPRPISAGKKLSPLYGFAALAAVWKYRNWSQSTAC